MAQNVNYVKAVMYLNSEGKSNLHGNSTTSISVLHALRQLCTCKLRTVLFHFKPSHTQYNDSSNKYRTMILPRPGSELLSSNSPFEFPGITTNTCIACFSTVLVCNNQSWSP